MSTKPAQYDDIVDGYNGIYDDLEALPAGQLEEANLKAALFDHIQNKRVLELACGSGHFSCRMLEWGARSVHGVDISSSMIESAETRARRMNLGDRLSYHVADASKGSSFGSHGAPFDVVVATWLLNYARSTDDMVGMWNTAANNMSSGGIFFGLTISPPHGNATEINRALTEEWARYGVSGVVRREVEDGFEIRTTLGFKHSECVEFDNYYLRPNAFERSVRESKMEGSLEWLPLALTSALVEGKALGYWNDAVLNPHFRICRVLR